MNPGLFFYRRAAVRYLSPDVSSPLCGERQHAEGQRAAYEIHSSSYAALCPIMSLPVKCISRLAADSE